MAENNRCDTSTDGLRGPVSDALTSEFVEDHVYVPSSQTLSSATPSLKAILWEVIKPVVTIGVVISIVGAVALYVYLHRVNWPELLQPSLASKTGIAVVVFSLLVVFISLTLTMYGSAYWANLVAHSYEQPRLIPRKLPIFAIAAHVLWTALLDIWILGFSEEKAYAWAGGVKLHMHNWLLGYFACVALASIACHWWARRNMFDVLEPESGFARILHCRLKSLFPSRNKDSQKLEWRIVQEDLWGRGKRISQDALRGSMLALGSVFASIASCVFVEINPSLRSQDVTFLNSLVVCCATLPGILVGVLYMIRYRASGSMKRSLTDVASFAMVTGVAACTMFPAATLLPLDTLSLGAASVFSETERQYAIEKRDAWALYERVGFRAIGTEARTESPIVFKAYERYRMGDILLLCTQPNHAVRGDAESKTSVRAAPNRIAEKVRATAAVGASYTSAGREGCVQVEKGEVRRVEIAE